MRFPPSPEYDKLMEAWKLPVALMGGTRVMREEQFLPQWPREASRSYNNRLQNATLYNAYRRTVRILSAKPLSRAIKADLGEAESWRNDVDRQNTHLDQFARKLLVDDLIYGLHHVIVDMPAQLPKNKKQERDQNIHPFFAHIDPKSIVRWQHRRGVSGELILQELWIQTKRRDFDVKQRKDVTVQVMKVWRENDVEIWEKKEEQETWTRKQVMPNTLGKIPLVTGYSESSRTGLMQADPPLEDLAHLNLRHFQSQSEQDVGLHYARVPFLFFAGFKEEQVTNTIAVDNAIINSNERAKVEWVETTGEALLSGKRDLESLEDRMDVMGADIMTLKPGNPTATAKAINTAEKVSDLQAMTINTERTIEQCYTIAGEWLNKDYDVEVNMFKEFGLTLKDKAELDLLLKARQSGDLSREQFHKELQRRGLTSEYDIPSELAKLQDVTEDDPA